MGFFLYADAERLRPVILFSVFQVDELRSGALRIADLSLTAIGTCINGEPTASVPEKPVCAVYNLLSALLSCNTFAHLLATDVFVGIIEQAKFYSELLIFGHKSGKVKVPLAVFNSCFQVLLVQATLGQLHGEYSARIAHAASLSVCRIFECVFNLVTHPKPYTEI